MVAAISVLDSKSPRRLERPPLTSAAGVRALGTGSFGSAGTVGATLRGTDQGGRAGRTTAPGRMSGEATPAALANTPVPPPPAEGPVADVSPADTIVFQACPAGETVEEAPDETPLIVSVDADANPVKPRRHRPLVLATAGAGITLAGAMLVGGWITGPGSAPEPVSLAGGHAAPQEPEVSEPGEQAEVLATEGQFSGILPIAETKQAAPPTTKPAASTTEKTTQRAAPKQTPPQPKVPRVQMPQVPEFDLPDYQPPRWDRDRDRGHRDGRHRH
ncbi:hypothetical protein [Amycolatopsis thermophila]|uniref:Serine/threonine protein kinase n=1 Tax=Amycolatopsis thermophila TaxID=206084 RepID=A0ABU0EUP7_9PSEU|nr:hypothetical protein [Amycolatopsis thermophila]MDQ0379038.1 hypothetical protein [Amycolatopsis thermophila]